MKFSPKAEASINKVIEKFKTGDLSPISKVVRIKLANDAPANNWSLSNKVLAFIQAEELDCRGFRQWQNVGRNIKKGSKAVYIIRPHTIKKHDEDEDSEKAICVGFSHIPVFPASCTKGESLPEYEPLDLPPLVEIAQKLGIQVAYIPTDPDRLGDCDSRGNKIRLGTHEPKVFFHELTHAIHARIDGELKGGQHTDQETIAEFTTAVLMDFYGLGDHSGNAWEYISRYSDDPLVAITKALSTVEKVLQVLLE